MRVLIATDAWHPQVNGVVRTLTALAESAHRLGVDMEFLTPEGFPSLPLPTYPGLRLALPLRRQIARRIDRVKPIAIKLAHLGSFQLPQEFVHRRHHIRMRVEGAAGKTDIRRAAMRSLKLDSMDLTSKAPEPC
jgi:hypothetical protein